MAFSGVTTSKRSSQQEQSWISGMRSRTSLLRSKASSMRSETESMRSETRSRQRQTESLLKQASDMKEQNDELARQNSEFFSSLLGSSRQVSRGEEVSTAEAQLLNEVLATSEVAYDDALDAAYEEAVNPTSSDVTLSASSPVAMATQLMLLPTRGQRQQLTFGQSREITAG